MEGWGCSMAEHHGVQGDQVCRSEANQADKQNEWQCWCQHAAGILSMVDLGW